MANEFSLGLTSKSIKFTKKEMAGIRANVRKMLDEYKKLKKKALGGR